MGACSRRKVQRDLLLALIKQRPFMTSIVMLSFTIQPEFGNIRACMFYSRLMESKRWLLEEKHRSCSARTLVGVFARLAIFGSRASTHWEGRLKHGLENDRMVTSNQILVAPLINRAARICRPMFSRVETGHKARFHANHGYRPRCRLPRPEFIAGIRVSPLNHGCGWQVINLGYCRHDTTDWNYPGPGRRVFCE